MLYLVNTLNFLVRNLDHVFQTIVCTPEEFWTQNNWSEHYFENMWEWWTNQCCGRRLGLEAENIYPQFFSLGRSIKFMFSSVQFSRSVVSDSLQLHGPQHAGLPCPQLAPAVYPNSCPLSRWCHPNISYSVVPFSSVPQSLPASESFPMRQLFSWGGQSTGVSASASVLRVNTQDWSFLGWTNQKK